ncbi:MAG: hypothetical protein ABWX71_04790 [Aeromicrobium sp.]
MNAAVETGDTPADATEFRHATVDVAAKLGCSPKTVRSRARAAGVGIVLDGRAGMRFSDRDVDILVASLRPDPLGPTPPVRRRRRRRGVPA